MPPSCQNQDRITDIFFPYVANKIREVPPSSRRFAYYTTADTAMKILRSKQIWLRNTAVMNDYSEIEYGSCCFEGAYKTDPGSKFKTALESCFPGLAEEVRKELFDDWRPIIRHDTYVTCLSEHLSGEDQHGRLSMWRAYGSGAGVALVINGGVMFSNAQVLKVISSPVAYQQPEEVGVAFNNIAKNIFDHADFLKRVSRDDVKKAVFNMFLFGIFCTKHPGFHEEREWRVIALPQMHKTEHLTSAIEVIRGVPQQILKLDLKNHPDQGLVGLARVMIDCCVWEGMREMAYSDGRHRSSNFLHRM